jgi:diphthamide synthase (EF-2-diphthine--ammonia ligase)
MTRRPTRTLVAWSSGKDSTYALRVLRRRIDVEVVGLLTTLNSSANRVSMHGVCESVLEAQARACGLPLLKVPLPDPCSNERYEEAMDRAIQEAQA